MKPIIVILIIIIVVEIYLNLLRCRHGHSAWQELRKFRYAHRGLHNKPVIPENSMAAFRRAIEAGFGAELDVHLMKDGNLAVIHDASLLRTCGVDVQIEDLTKEDLENYRLEGTEERIPLFSEVLELFSNQTPLIVELKSERGNYNELAKATCDMLDHYSVKYCIESFDPRCLMWLKKNRSEIVRGQLAEQFNRHGDGAPQSKFTLWILGNLFMNFLTWPDFIAYRFSDRNNLSVKVCRGLYKVQEVNWTISSKEEMAASEALNNLVIFERFNPRD